MVVAQIILAGALAKSFFVLGLLYGFKQLHSEQVIMPFWKMGYRAGERVNAIILSFLLPIPIVGMPVMLVLFVLEKS